MDVPLRQILHYRVVVRKVTVVDKRLVQSYKRVRSAGMPDSAFRGIAVVADPYVSLEIFQPVILYNIISISDQFENNQVLTVRDDECFLLAQRRVVLEVEPVAVLVDELVLELAALMCTRLVLPREVLSNLRLDPYQLSGNFTRLHLEA